MDKIKAIIFDMDGLMFDTERLYEEAFAVIAKKWGYESEISKEFIKSFKGKSKASIKILYKSLLDKISIKREGKGFDFDEYLKQVLAYMFDFIEKKGMPIKEGLLELLKCAKENNLKTAIGTSENYQRVKFYLEKANIPENTFGVIICGDMVANGKPAPDIFLRACKELSVNPKETIVLEDSPNGIIAAHRAGAKPIMIIDCVEPTDKIIGMLFTKPLKSLAEVQKIILG